MNMHQYLKESGLSQQEFADRLGVTQGNVGHWLHSRHRITAERAIQIEEATHGAVTREELRPDLFVR